MKKLAKKLSLTRQTVKLLGAGALGKAAGGYTDPNMTCTHTLDIRCTVGCPTQQRTCQQ